VAPWWDHRTARRTRFFGHQELNLADEEVRLGVTSGEAHHLWQLPVDLEWVATVLEADPMRCQGAFLDLQTGEVVAGDLAADRREAEPDRWLLLPCLGSRAVRQDMAEFAAMIKYLPMRQRIE
jgi:hypothetical protein